MRYRLTLGGLPWFLRTAFDFAMQKMRRPLSVQSPYVVGIPDAGTLSILYIHTSWSIENVGKLWFNNQDKACVTFIHWRDPALGPKLFELFDFVWYGYADLYNKYPCPLSKVVISIHDPAELFPEKPDWKLSAVVAPEQAEIFQKTAMTVVGSKEMQDVLAVSGVKAFFLPTSSFLPFRNENEISLQDRAKLLAVGRIYPRKNFEQFRRVAAASLPVPSFLKLDHFPASEERYVHLLDSFSIYLCTSFQEGGPLPVMDAMRRGCVPLSTPVGQVPEIIKDGYNGFICVRDEDFISKIKLLNENPDLLYSMRLRSLKSIREARDEGAISSEVGCVLDHLSNLKIKNYP